MSTTMTSTQRRRIQELKDLAHERALTIEFTRLETGFARWRAGEIDVFELAELIDMFHHGPERELRSFYGGSTALGPAFAVVTGLLRNMLSEEEIEPEILKLIRWEDFRDQRLIESADPQHGIGNDPETSSHS